VPPPHEFTDAYRRLSREADEIVAIVISSNLSGMYSVAHLGAQNVPEIRVHVVDSGQVTMGLGWMVIAAAEAATEGRNAREILSLIDGLRPRVHVYATLDTLEYLRRSGRVSWPRARAADALRIKPIVEVAQGEVKDAGRTRTRRRAIERVLEMTRALGPLERLSIIHTCAPETDQLRSMLAEHHSPAQLVDVAVTTVIGAHVGPRAIGVAAVAAADQGLSP
jgi:DegV family protein with EDD domain